MSDWWKGAVIYQVYPRSFADSNNDGVGDLPGLLARLDYIADLGVDAIWISPFFASPMRDYGYDISDFLSVDPLFGTLADFDAIVARAHALSIKVIIDQVYSHTSDEHEWFRDSRASRTGERADWYVWADAKPDGSPPNNWQSLFHGPAWTWDARRGQYYLHNFLSQQPDLNLLNPRVQDALLEVAAFWLERGVDGFRIDAVSHFTHDAQLRDNPPRIGGVRRCPVDFQRLLYNSDRPETLVFLTRLRALMDRYTGRFALGEIGGPDAAERGLADYLSPDRLHTAYSFKYLRVDELTPAVVREADAEWARLHGTGWPTWVFSNHDAPRVADRWHVTSDTDTQAVLFNAVLLTLRGSICLYQGEELGLPQAEVPFERLRDPEAIANWPDTLGRDGARTPIPWVADDAYAGFSTVEPWLPVDQRHRDRALDRQRLSARSVYSMTRQLLRLRRAHPALVRGSIRYLEAPDGVLAYERAGDGERLVCVFNLGRESCQFALPADAGWQPLAGTAAVGAGMLALAAGSWLIAQGALAER